MPAEAADWQGTVSSDWFVSGNWNPGAVPGSGTAVNIDTVATNPTINSGAATSAALSLGSAVGQNGTLNLTGGSLAVSGTAFIGRFGTGTLNMSGGAVMTSTGLASIGENGNTSGTVTVSGSGTQFRPAQLWIANDANVVGQVTIQNGAALVTGATNLGTADATSNGTLTVTSGSSASMGTMQIGQTGTGVFNLNGGSTATSGSVAIGSNSATGNGTANIAGSGTTWTNGGVNLGTVGTGTLTISNGASVTSNRSIGVAPVVSIGGTATVTGTGSQWSIDGSQFASPFDGQVTLGIGSKANTAGSLTVSNGGTVTIRNNATDGRLAEVRIGVASGSTGTLTVTGANSTMTTPYNISVGSNANTTGNLTVAAGGTLNTGYAQIGFSGTGSATVTGAGSVWNISDTPNASNQPQGLQIGSGAASVGSLTIANGGTVNVTATGGLIRLGGQAGSQGTLNIGADALSPAAAAGTLNATAVVFVTGATSTINFNHTSTNYAFTAGIQGTGPGTVNFLSGTTILSGNNTYTGTTTISAGATAQLGNGSNPGGSGGLVSGNIANDGNLIFNAGGFRTYSGVISGNGTVEQRGPTNTTLTLTGNNTYTGQTIISSGTLQVGSGGTTGTISDNVLNNSILAFNRSDNVSYNGVISGSGSLDKSGAGTLTLTGVNTYTGGTSVGPGILRLGGNDRIAATGRLFLFSTGTFDLAGFNQTVGDLSGPGTVAISTGTFTAGTANNRTFAGRFTGSGAFIKQGSGLLELTGNNAAYTGTTTVNAGTLAVNGDLSGSAVTVNAGGTLGGTGTVGTTVVNGVIAPGNSIGTINVAGNYTQATGSTYRVEINNTPASDLINITGTAAIQSGATVNVVPAAGFYTLGHRYTILTAAGGRTGTYDALIYNAPFLDLALAYDANNVYLDVTRSSVSFQQIAQTPNQRAAAYGAETLGSGNPVFNSVVSLDTPNARRAFDLLSGEIHASVSGTLIEDSRFLREAIGGRLRQFAGSPSAFFAPRIATLDLSGGANALAFDATAMAYASKTRPARDTMDRALASNAAPPQERRTFTAWAQGFGNWGRTNGDGNAAMLNRNTGGIASGVDVTLPGPGGALWRAGLAGAFQNTSVDAGERSSSGTIESRHLAAYAGMQHGALGLRAGASYGWSDIATRRTIAFPGFSDATRASYGGRTAQVFGEAGYGIRYQNLAFEPFAGLSYVNVWTDSFAESGGAAALTAANGNANTTFSTLGLRASAPLPLALPDNALLIAKGSAGWRHAFGTIVPTSQLSFSNTARFTVAGVPIAKDAAALELGLDGRISRHDTFGISYAGQIAGAAYDHGVSAHYARRF